jgi:hypothetical protein
LLLICCRSCCRSCCGSAADLAADLLLICCRSCCGFAAGLAADLLPVSDKFLEIVGDFGQNNVPFSLFNDNQSKSFLHLPAFLKIQHSFCNEEIRKKRDYADGRRHVFRSIGFVAFCLIE